LVYEGFSAAAVQALLVDCDQFVYGRTQSKRVLGCLNDMAYLYRWEIWDGKSLDGAISNLNDTPYGKGFPMDELKALVSQAIESS
jgi:hypothetical protein